MSGHSKWATIKRQKGVADAKRGQAFTKLSMAITIAVRTGGGITDPNSNFKLRLAVDRARAANMPKENIERAISKGVGSDAGAVEELLYEGFAPHGVALLVEAVTDNKQRTVSNVKNIFDKSGGTLGTSGSVSYLFKRVGQIVVKKNGKSADELLDIGISAGASDMEDAENDVIFYTEPSDLQSVRNGLEEASITPESAELVFIAGTPIALDEESQGGVVSLIEKLEELDDVQSVYSNAEFAA